MASMTLDYLNDLDDCDDFDDIQYSLTHLIFIELSFDISDIAFRSIPTLSHIIFHISVILIHLLPPFYIDFIPFDLKHHS